MELKTNSNNNVCEYFNESNGSIIHVLSGDNGLWFNLNDMFNLFGTIKSDKLWFSKNLKNHEKIKVEFYRNNRKGEEFFIPEQKVHDLISKIQGSFNDNVDFIYGIIADYDTTCINIKEIDLNTEERIALHALKSESINFVERTEKYMNILEGKTKLSDYYNYFDEEINNEIKASELKYDNKKCPEDLRIEEKESHFNHNKNNKKDTIEGIGKDLNDALVIIESFINKFDEDIFNNEEFINETDNEKIYDDIFYDNNSINESYKYVHECLNEQIQRGNLIEEIITKLENQNKKRK